MRKTTMFLSNKIIYLIWCDDKVCIWRHYLDKNINRPFPNFKFIQILLFRLYLRKFVTNCVFNSKKSKLAKF